MWTKRDWLQMFLVASATCCFTATILSPRPATAQQQPPAAAVPIPSLQLSSCSITAAAVKDDRTVEIKDALAIVQPDSTPTLKITVVNQSDNPQSINFTATVTVFTAKDMLSRALRIIPPAWTHDYTLTLKPRETQTIDVQPGIAVPALGSVRLAVKNDKQAAGLLSFSTPPAKPGAAPAPIAPIIQANAK